MKKFLFLFLSSAFCVLLLSCGSTEPASVESNETTALQKTTEEKSPMDTKEEMVTEKPEDKVEPQKPEDKVEPQKPEDKVEPQKPEDKVEPEKPEDKVEPQKPEDKVEPEFPADKVEPETPEDTVEPETPEIPVAKQSMFTLSQDTSLYKITGRGYIDEKGLHLSFAGDALEFRMTCSGTVTMNYSADADLYFQTYINGLEHKRLFAEKGSDKTLTLAEDLEKAEYTFRILRDSDANPKAPMTAVSSITFYGEKESVSPTEKKNLLIEFVGDSITAGKYTETQYPIDNLAIHKATNSYAYLTAEKLNADYSIVARGGCGYFRVSTCPKTMNQLYPYYNGFLADPVLYTPQRKADIVVLALGTNDGKSNVTESFNNGTVPFSTFEEALKDQIRLIREMHGEEVKIILMYNMMSSNWSAEMKKVAAEENTHILKVTRNREGGKNHPSINGHLIITKELTNYIKNNLL